MYQLAVKHEILVSICAQDWDWFNGRNFCRDRCMDLVSFETREEYEWVKGFINGKIIRRFMNYLYPLSITLIVSSLFMASSFQ